MEVIHFFPYSWNIDEAKEEEDEHTLIRIYGLTEDNESICIKIDNFTPYIYLELPIYINWNEGKIQLLYNYICENLLRNKNMFPRSKRLVYKKKLYGANIDPEGNKLVYPYLLLSFTNKKYIKFLERKIQKKIFVQGLGFIELKMHEQSATPILQLVCVREISTANWIKAKGYKSKVKITLCKHEFDIDYKNLFPSDITKIPRPKILSFDLEVNSTVNGSMPKPEREGDEVFQISCIIQRQGEEYMDCYLLTLGKVDREKVGEEVNVIEYSTEFHLIKGFSEFIVNNDVNIIIGYNIFGFDIDYLVKRTNYVVPCREYAMHSYLKNTISKETEIKWSSSAYGDQRFKFIDAEGRLYIDLLPLIKRDYKFSSYSLKNVSTEFLGETKDPLDAKGIFKCYRVGMKGVKPDATPKEQQQGEMALAICGKYCVKDSVLVLKLFDKIQGWIGLTELAKIFNVPIFYLYTRGQQIKVYSQVYLQAMKNNFVVETVNMPDINEHFMGAHVFAPKPGLYNYVVPLDYFSLYPVTIITHNICWSTYVTEDNYPDELCNIAEWEEHVGCKHDTEVRKTKPAHILCNHRKFRFLKKPMGLLPSILLDGLNERKNVKNMIKNINENPDKDKDLELLLRVLDKRQLSIKISLNSFYGSLGVKKGYLPFMPGAMATTAKGREAVLLASKIATEEFNGELVYGDSVLGNTPVILRDIIGRIYIKRIDTLGHEWVPYRSFRKDDPRCREKYQSYSHFEIWSKDGWAKIRRVIRHEVNKNIHRVFTHSGFVDTTEDHSLLTINNKKIDPKSLIKNDEIRHSFPTEFYNDKKNITLYEAYILGFFLMFGGIKMSTNKWYMEHENLYIVTYMKSMLEVFYSNINFIIAQKKNLNFMLTTLNYEELFMEIYLSMFYDFVGKKAYKKVPDIILNSNNSVKRAFLAGCYLKKDYICMKNRVIMQGLYFIYKSLNIDVCITSRGTTPVLLFKKCPDKDKNKIISIKGIRKYNYTSMVYDIETNKGNFNAGVGEITVSNTDSTLMVFPHIKTPEELWDYSIHVADEITKRFTEPMKLEFEEKIYYRFLILTKKRYMSLECDKHGNVSDKISKKGVLLARRDNSKCIRDIYESMIMDIFYKVPEEEILYNLIQEFIKTCKDVKSYKDFIITKSVRNINAYKIRELPKEDTARIKRLNDLRCSEEEYNTKALPAQAQLLIKMQKRGDNVDSGTRLQYVVLDTGNDKDKLFDKIEDAEFYKNNKYTHNFRIDHIYYLKLLSKQLDDVIMILYNKPNYTANILKHFSKTIYYNREIQEDIKQYFKPNIIIEEIEEIREIEEENKI